VLCAEQVTPAGWRTGAARDEDEAMAPVLSAVSERKLRGRFHGAEA
jgi:hypothetical protein